jgi:hypothetical protein
MDIKKGKFEGHSNRGGAIKSTTELRMQRISSLDYRRLKYLFLNIHSMRKINSSSKINRCSIIKNKRVK